MCEATTTINVINISASSQNVLVSFLCGKKTYHEIYSFKEFVGAQYSLLTLGIML